MQVTSSWLLPVNEHAFLLITYWSNIFPDTLHFPHVLQEFSSHNTGKKKAWLNTKVVVKKSSANCRYTKINYYIFFAIPSLLSAQIRKLLYHPDMSFCWADAGDDKNNIIWYCNILNFSFKIVFGKITHKYHVHTLR